MLMLRKTPAFAGAVLRAPLEGEFLQNRKTRPLARAGLFFHEVGAGAVVGAGAGASAGVTGGSCVMAPSLAMMMFGAPVLPTRHCDCHGL